MKIKKLIPYFSGLIIGAINGLLGAGGGMVAVPMLRKIGMDQKKAHANAVAVILPISLISAVFYIIKGNVAVRDALPFIPAGVVGAVIATYALIKISPTYLKIIFGGFMVWAGIRMFV